MFTGVDSEGTIDPGHRQLRNRRQRCGVSERGQAGPGALVKSRTAQSSDTRPSLIARYPKSGTEEKGGRLPEVRHLVASSSAADVGDLTSTYLPAWTFVLGVVRWLSLTPGDA
jgi:hypothetical protein